MGKAPKSFKDYWNEYRKQAEEHPRLPAWALKQIVKDHLKRGKKNYG